MSVTEARAKLCSLLGDERRPEIVAITRRGQTIGLLLVGSAAVARGQVLVAGPDHTLRRTLRGTVEIHGNLEGGLRKVRERLWRRGRS